MSQIRRNLTSDIWQFFTPSGTSGFAICNMCKKQLSYKSTTTNLKKHIVSKHPTVSLTSRLEDQQPCSTHQVESQHLEVAVDDPQPGPSSSSTSDAAVQVVTAQNLTQSTRSRTAPSVSATTSSQQQPSTQQTITSFLPKKISAATKKKYDNLLVLLFTDDLLPFNIVNGKGFKAFVRGLCPQYQMPTRQYISSTLISAKYEELLIQCKEKISHISHLSLTTDTWTSMKTESFLALTAHFINDNFEIKTLLVDCSEITSSHTAENIANEIRKITSDWQLNDKIVSVVTDNASNMKNAVTRYLKWEHLPCFAHSINLIVKRSMEGNQNIIDLLNKVRTIVKHFKKSGTSWNKLKNYLVRDGRTVLKLIHDVTTRWNSTYYMLDRFLLLENPIKATIAIIDKDLPVLTSLEWETLHEIVVILKPLESVTKAVSGDRYITASMLIPLRKCLYDVYATLAEKPFCSETKDILTKIETGIKDRFSHLEENPILSICTLLDPRFKNAAFCNIRAVNLAKANIIAETVGTLCESSDSSTEVLTSNSQILNEQCSESDETELLIWNTFDQLVASQQPQEMPNAIKVENELDLYLAERFLPRNENPLNWWKNNAVKFPHLSCLVRKYFSITGTSVPSERVFSKSGAILNERRSSLSSSKVQKLLFLNCNSPEDDALYC